MNVAKPAICSIPFCLDPSLSAPMNTTLEIPLIAPMMIFCS